mgnify:CR=1 FL=1
MNYLEIEFQKVDGYKKLSEPAKLIFQWVYKRHNAQQGKDYKKDWIPKKVKEYSSHLIVYFVNGEWLHYLPNGTWY